jgi:hypothetical protein
VADKSNPTPELDVFSLAGETDMEKLMETFDYAMNNDNPLGYEGVPALVSQVAGIIMSRSIRVIRTGTPSEVADDAYTITSSVVERIRKMEEEGVSLEEPLKRAFELVNASADALDAANSSATEFSVLRSTDGLAAKAFCFFADADPEDQKHPYGFHSSEVAEGIGHEDKRAVHFAVCALQRAGLITIIDVKNLTFVANKPRLDQRESGVDEIMVLARAYAEAYDNSRKSS